MSESSRPQKSIHSTGIVYLVGAGPGDPGLLTLKGYELLQKADFILYDGLVNPLILRHANAQSERTARAKTDGERLLEQEQINARLIEEAQLGKNVVRLKGGDPFIFGRGSEEAVALANAGIAYEIVPGITAATAASEYAGISLTHRNHASAVAFVTGHEDPTKPNSALDYRNLAEFPGTLVFYMGLHRVRAIAEQLIQSGKSPSTPAAVICKASRPHQQTVTGTLETLGEKIDQAGLKPPSLIVVGDVVTLRDQIAWFENQPLFGQSIGITRPLAQAEPQVQQVSRLGGDPVLMPMIDTVPVEQPDSHEEVLNHLGEYRWIVFTSQNGVQAFFEWLWRNGKDVRAISNARIACIGERTAAALEGFQLRADLVPEKYRSEELAEVLIQQLDSGPVLWPRANRGREVLPERLAQQGIELKSFVVYEHLDAETLAPAVIEKLQSGQLQWIGLSSPAIARRFHQLWQKLPENKQLKMPQLVSISPVTSQVMQEIGLPVSAEATTYTWDGIIEAITKALHSA